MTSDEILYAIALRNCPLIGDITFRKLVKITGSAKEVWECSKSKDFDFPNAYTRGIGDSKHLELAEKEIKYCEDHGITILYSEDKQLPGLLCECDDAPVLLYQKGAFHDTYAQLSMVGTRSLTGYGRDFLNELLRELQGRNIQTISGLALGADTAVHEESLNNSIPTVAVLAHGLDKLYPSKNKNLLERILQQNGGVLSEFPTFAPFVRENFLRRNRIIAGISPATIVIETAFGGGSMSTANFANQYNREVLALPGNIANKYSQGCNLLIAQNKARIIVDIKSTIEYLGFENTGGKQLNLFEKAKDYSLLDEEQNEVMQLIANLPGITLDDLAEKCEKPSYKILPLLLELELQGFIQSSSARQYTPA